MRWTLLLLTLAAGCSLSDETGEPVPGRSTRIPGVLAELVVNENHPTMTPVEFPHALHVDEVVMGKAVKCRDCHHRIDDARDGIPRACTECHMPAYLAPEVDESKPHEHTLPPDL
ncbi:MAG: cytochrome c3 family protein [Planctomycetota bacterium]|jgi:hypothetical protein